MLERIRNYVLIALAAAVFYFFMTHHVFFTSFTDYDLLKKIEPTFKYTFVSIKQINPVKIVQVTALREAGVGDLLLKRGLISQVKLTQALEAIEAKSEAESEQQ